MSAAARLAPIVLLVGTLQLGLTPQAGGEIVAWIDGDVITRLDLERQDETTLLDMIDRKILHHRGQQLFGSKEMEEFLYRDFRQQNGLSDEEEFQRFLAREGLTVEDLKRRLSEKFVPGRVIEHEVAASMPGISNVEVREYYDRHPDEFMAPAEMTLQDSEERLIPFDESIDRARESLQNQRYMEQLDAFLQMARGQAEWWVKAEYRDHLPEGVKPTREEIPW